MPIKDKPISADSNTKATAMKQNPLEIPEILARIGYYLHPWNKPNVWPEGRHQRRTPRFRPKDLIACTEVSRLWHACFIPVLWSHYREGAMEHLGTVRAIRLTDEQRNNPSVISLLREKQWMPGTASYNTHQRIEHMNNNSNNSNNNKSRLTKDGNGAYDIHSSSDDSYQPEMDGSDATIQPYQYATVSLIQKYAHHIRVFSTSHGHGLRPFRESDSPEPLLFLPSSLISGEGAEEIPVDKSSSTTRSNSLQPSHLDRNQQVQRWLPDTKKVKGGEEVSRLLYRHPHQFMNATHIKVLAIRDWHDTFGARILRQNRSSGHFGPAAAAGGSGIRQLYWTAKDHTQMVIIDTVVHGMLPSLAHDTGMDIDDINDHNDISTGPLGDDLMRWKFIAKELGHLFHTHETGSQTQMGAELMVLTNLTELKLINTPLSSDEILTILRNNLGLQTLSIALSGIDIDDLEITNTGDYEIGDNSKDNDDSNDDNNSNGSYSPTSTFLREQCYQNSTKTDNISSCQRPRLSKIRREPSCLPHLTHLTIALGRVKSCNIVDLVLATPALQSLTLESLNGLFPGCREELDAQVTRLIKNLETGCCTQLESLTINAPTMSLQGGRAVLQEGAYPGLIRAAAPGPIATMANPSAIPISASSMAYTKPPQGPRVRVGLKELSLQMQVLSAEFVDAVLDNASTLMSLSLDVMGETVYRTTDYIPRHRQLVSRKNSDNNNGNSKNGNFDGVEADSNEEGEEEEEVEQGAYNELRPSRDMYQLKRLLRGCGHLEKLNIRFELPEISEERALSLFWPSKMGDRCQSHISKAKPMSTLLQAPVSILVQAMLPIVSSFPFSRLFSSFASFCSASFTPPPASSPSSPYISSTAIKSGVFWACSPVLKELELHGIGLVAVKQFRPRFLCKPYDPFEGKNGYGWSRFQDQLCDLIQGMPRLEKCVLDRDEYFRKNKEN